MEDTNKLRETLEKLNLNILEIAARPAPKPEIFDRELSGNKINGGMITNFSSVGIKDKATNTVLSIDDNGLTVENLNVKNVNSSCNINGDLHVNGEITALKLHVKELTADIRNERSTPLEFTPTNGSLNGKGVIWTGIGSTKQLIFRENNDRIWSSENLELARDKELFINSTPVIGFDYLGDTVYKSKLKHLGIVENLKTEGNLTVDNFIFYDGGTSRLGIGTEEPSGMFSMKGFETEFILDESQGNAFKLGTYSASTLQIVTDDTVRINVSESGLITLKKKVLVDGCLNINVKNAKEDVDLTTSGPIRIQNKKFAVSDNSPTADQWALGDIVWNSNPKPTSYVGWVCIKEGAPGIWKGFGQIQN